MADCSGVEILVESVARRMADPENPLLASSILGTSDATDIARSVDAFVQRNTGRHVRDSSLCEFSVNAVFGLVLEDGQRVLLKIHGPDRELGSLRAVYHVQDGLHTKGVPCPDVLVPPVPFGGGAALIQAYVDAGEYRDAHQPQIRRVMAELLATLVRQAREFRGTPNLPTSRLPRRALWPVPHNALFDFARTTSGAEWIDHLASRAKEVLARPTGEIIVGHSDWSVKHFRFTNSTVQVVYDWDSLVVESELILVGSAAATFTATWYLPVRVAPTTDETRHFVTEYESARGAPFTTEERRHIDGAITYALAYSARCEHALDPDGKRYTGSFREALAYTRGG